MAEKLQCAEFEGLLADAVEGSLAEPRMQVFRAHAEACAACGPMFREAAAGLRWMSALKQADVEPPAHLMRNILLATSGAAAAETAAQKAGKSWKQRVSDWASPLVSPVFAGMMQPRFALMAAMAFFSVSLVLNVAGVEYKHFQRLDLRPTAIRSAVVRQYNETTASVVKYYDNIRFVYEIQSRVQELKEAATPAQEPASPSPDSDKTNDKTSGQPDEDQRDRYTQEQFESRLAELRNHPSLAPFPLTTNRRSA